VISNFNLDELPASKRFSYWQEIVEDLFAAVSPGYHMNKRHWNTVRNDGSLPEGELQRLIDQSYALVVKGLARAVRQGLEARHGHDALYRGAAGGI